MKKEKRFRTLIENNHDIIALIDSSLRIIYRSPSSTRITSWTDEDVLFENVTNNVHPEDKDKIAKITSEVMANPESRLNAGAGAVINWGIIYGLRALRSTCFMMTRCRPSSSISGM